MARSPRFVASAFILFATLLVLLPLHKSYAKNVSPEEAFGRLPSFAELDISPSGKRILARYYIAKSAKYGFVILEMNDNGNVDIVDSILETDDQRLVNPFWKDDENIVVTLEFAARRYHTETVETRLLRYNIKDKKLKSLFPRVKDGQKPIQLQDDIVSYLPNDPNHILVQYDATPDRLYKKTVFRVSIDRPGRHKQVQTAKYNILDWQADQKGVIRSGWGLSNNQTIPKLIVLGTDGKWVDLSHRVSNGQKFEIEAFSNDPDIIYVLSTHESDTAGLYPFSVSQDTFLDPLYENEHADVVSVVQSKETGALLGVRYGSDEDIKTKWFEGSLSQQIEQKLTPQIVGAKVKTVDFNWTDTHALVKVEGAIHPGFYLIYDIENDGVATLPSQYPLLKDFELGGLSIQSYTARDGLNIPAYLTVPAGYNRISQLKDLPFVVLPHGGPHAREFAGFDWWAQFLASQGYGVLQMNFRGSTGYGDDFRQAGKRQWGQAMQDDITDGTKWLIDKGYADPERIAIMGASYGGYAALMGAVKTPDLYQCAVTHGAAADLPKLISHSRQYVGGTYRTRHIGRLWKDGKMLRENSPAKRADEIQIPVLMFHGEKDRVVPIDQSKLMARALKKQGKKINYIELSEGSHFLDVGTNRIQFLKEMKTFLSDCLQ